MKKTIMSRQMLYPISKSARTSIKKDKTAINQKSKNIFNILMYVTIIIITVIINQHFDFAYIFSFESVVVQISIVLLTFLMGLIVASIIQVLLYLFFAQILLKEKA